MGFDTPPKDLGFIYYNLLKTKLQNHLPKYVFLVIIKIDHNKIMSNHYKKILKKIINSSPDPGLILKAYNFAEKAHEGQKRNSGEDYIIHPLYTALYLSEMQLTPNTVAAGLLHDVIDDTPVTLEEIKKEFGKEIAFLVEGVSKLGKIKYRGVERYVENLRKVFLAMAQDIRVILIKLCDRLHNLETLNFQPDEKAKRIAIETIEIYVPVANRLGIGELTGRLEDAAFAFAYPAEYRQLLTQVKDKYEKRKKYLDKVKPIILKRLKQEGIKSTETHYRSKRYWSLYKKLKRLDNDLNKIHDLVALRIIVKDIETCYKTIGIIHKLWKPLPGRIKDYIAAPKPNGYRSLHTTVFCIDGKITEFQIRTPQIHKESEYGIAAHWYYTEKIGLKNKIKKLISKPPTQEIQWINHLKQYQEKTKTISPDKYLNALKLDFFNDRIFVFSPKGDVIDLPEGATPVDFAYAIHTEVGNTCQRAKVNDKISPLSQPLKNGDLVEIIIQKNKKPSQDWLKFVKTNLAKYRIKNAFKDKIKIRVIEEKKEKESFFKIPALTFKKEKKAAAPITPKATTVSISGQTGILTRMAKCCEPQQTNEISAYITKDHGATIHRSDCKNIINFQKKWPERIIKASWKTKTD